MIKIAITGSTGWLGRSANAAILQLIKSGHDLHVENYSSKPADVCLIDGFQYRTKTYDQLNNSIFDLYIPLGFPTQEKYQILGKNEYKLSIDLLVERDIKSILNNPLAKVLLISSGVVNQLSESQSTNYGYEFYAKMKVMQEEYLTESVGVDNLSVCYLYSCTSKDIRDFNSYAFSSMVKKAIYNENIHISNALPVIRKYVDLRELFTVMLLEILSGKTFRISSGGQKIEIGELANLIVKVTNSSSKISRATQGSDAKSDLYYSEDACFEELFQAHNFRYSNLNAQLENVIAAVRTFA